MAPKNKNPFSLRENGCLRAVSLAVLIARPQAELQIGAEDEVLECFNLTRAA